VGRSWNDPGLNRLTPGLQAFTDYSLRIAVSKVAFPMPLLALQMLEKKIERRIRLLERKSGLRFLDEVAFIRSWIEKPISMGAVTPSGKMLARAMARCVDPAVPGPVIELGSGTGAVTKALVARGVEPSRLVLVEFNPSFCRLLRTRYPDATVIQGDAYRIEHLLGDAIVGLAVKDEPRIGVDRERRLAQSVKLFVRRVPSIA